MINYKKQISDHKITFFDRLESVETSLKVTPVDLDLWFGRIIDLLTKMKKNNNRLFFIGNGASCSMASHFAVDFTKNAGINSFSINEGTLLTCFSNDYNYETAYMEILKRYISKDDTLIAISSSGESPNIINAVNFVATGGLCKVVTLSGFNSNNQLRKIGDFNLFVNHVGYGHVESIHAYYLHLLIDLFIGITHI